MRRLPPDPRGVTNPLFNDNELKLGLFGINAGHQVFTQAPGRFIADWPRCDTSVGLADALGLEVAVSLMGWEKPELEPFTWAAALGARHRALALIATLHVQLNHPSFVAKAAATIDHVTAGRFGLNLVAGANPASFGAFGQALEGHDTRYDHAIEFIELLGAIWRAEAPLNFEGRFYKVTNLVSLPKPIQRFPAIMNAGTSGRGREFACKYADIVFTHIAGDAELAKAQIDQYKAHAKAEYGRSIQLWTHGYCVIRDTEKQATDFLDNYAVKYADHEAVRKWVAALGAAAESLSAQDRWKFDRNWAAGGGVALVGTADMVADALARLSAMGVDGVLLNTIEPENMLHHVGTSLLPRLEAAGLRHPQKITPIHAERPK